MFEPRDRVRLLQLLVCLALFLAVYIGKGLLPDRMTQAGDRLLSLITADTDFRAALSDLGASLSNSGTVLDDLGAFCVEVFGGEQENLPAQPASVLLPPEQDTLEEEVGFLSGSAGGLPAHYLGREEAVWEPPAGQEGAASEKDSAEAGGTAAPAVIPAAGTVVFYSSYDGEPLPERYTMDKLSLGDLETTTPVLGKLTSTYGYRDHPVDGGEDFHGGVDISGEKGDRVVAFADGVVEYIGENDSYGLYFQIDHGNGVKSFYAHCSKLCVSKGQAVSLGEKVAEVGETGIATGPHLHLELKYNRMHVDPAYYISFLPEE